MRNTLRGVRREYQTCNYRSTGSIVWRVGVLESAAVGSTGLVIQEFGTSGVSRLISPQLRCGKSGKPVPFCVLGETKTGEGRSAPGCCVTEGRPSQVSKLPAVCHGLDCSACSTTRLLLEPPRNRLCIRLQDEKGSPRYCPFRGCFSMHRFGFRIGAFTQGNMRVIVWASCA